MLFSDENQPVITPDLLFKERKNKKERTKKSLNRSLSLRIFLLCIIIS
jgi:hypothetical protein